MARIIPRDVAHYFEVRGLMEPTCENKRKFSISTLASGSSRSFSSGGSSSILSTSEFGPVDFIEIPENLYSKETYEFMGLTEEIASKIWKRYNTRDPAMPDSFLEFAQYHIEMNNTPDGFTRSDDWDACMKHMGVTKPLRDAILIPEFEDLRCTESAKYWVMDAFEMRLGSLECLTERIINSMQTKQRKPGYSYSSSSSSGFPQSIPLVASSSSVALNKASKQNQGEKQPKELKKMAKAGVQLEVAAPSPIPAGFTTIWKALDKRRCNGFLDPASGRINLDPIVSRWLTDFHGTAGAVYFTPQKYVADRYALWAKQKADIAEVMIIQIDVPFELTEGKFGYTDFTHRIWSDGNPDCEWNQLIWTSRRRERRPRNLAHLQKYGMLIGHICTGRDSNITSMPNHRSITDKHLLKVYDNGSWINGIQWMVQGEEARGVFEEKCLGHAHVWSMGQLAVPQ